MRYVRFRPKNSTSALYGSLSSDALWIAALNDNPITAETVKETGMRYAVSDVTLLAPVRPSKILGIGLNYKDHAAEQGKPLPEKPYVFIKSLNALLDPLESIKINRHCTNVHHEGELAVVIGRKCGPSEHVAEENALDHVFGYTIGNDVTDRAIQKEELSYARAKGMDTFCPLGPYLVTDIEWKNKSIRVWVNETIRQNGNTNDLIHSVPKLIAFIAQFMTLNPGDVILTGTPAGVGPIKAGDRVRVEIEDLGVLENGVERQE